MKYARFSAAKRTKALLAGVVAGLASPASFGSHVEYTRVAGSDLSRMRGDVMRIGQDFSRVIEHEKAAIDGSRPPAI